MEQTNNWLELDDIIIVNDFTPNAPQQGVLSWCEQHESITDKLADKALIWLHAKVDELGLTILEAVMITRQPRKLQLVGEFAIEYPHCHVQQVVIKNTYYTTLLLPKQTISQAVISALFETFAEFSRPLKRYKTTFYYPFDLNGEAALKTAQPNHLTDLQKRQVTLPSGVLNIEAPRYQFHYDVGNDPQYWDFNKQQQVQTFLFYNPQAQSCLFGDLKDTNAKNTVNAFEEYRLTLEGCILGISTGRVNKTSTPTKLSEFNIKTIIEQQSQPSATVTSLNLIRHPVARGSFLLAIEVQYSPIYSLPEQTKVAIKQLLKQQNSMNTFNGDLSDAQWWWSIVLAAYSSRLAKLVKGMQFGRWLKFNQQARILYPTFIEQKEEQKINCLVLLLNQYEHLIYNGNKPSGLDDLTLSNENRQPVAEHVLRLVSLFFLDEQSRGDPKKQNAIIDQLNPLSMKQHDSRMYLNATYGIYGVYPQTKLGKKVAKQNATLASMVDSPNGLFNDYPTGYAYNAQFVKELAQQQAYTRWQDISAQTGFNEFATITIGYGSYYVDHILPHWHSVYRHFFNYTLLTRETINCFKRTMNQATEDLAAKDTDAKPENTYRDIRRNFILFMNRYWFKSLSHEQQGAEIYQKLYQATALEQHFELVKEQVSWADDYMESWRNIYFVDKADKTGQIAGILALIAIVTAWPQSLDPFGSDTLDRILLMMILGVVILMGIKTKLFAAVFGLLDFITQPNALFEYQHEKIASWLPARLRGLAHHYKSGWANKLKKLRESKKGLTMHHNKASQSANKNCYDLIKVEAVNFDNALSLSNNLSVYRGTSMLLRAIVLELPKYFDSLEPISVGGSVGLYKCQSDQQLLCEQIIDRLNSHHQGITFIVNGVSNISDANFLEAKIALINAGRKRQLQQTSLSIDLNQQSNLICQLSETLPATDNKYIQDGNKHISALVKERFEYGRDQKQQFYNQELAQLAVLNNQPYNDNKERFFTHSFDELCNAQEFYHLDNKVAYIYFDGNKFSKIQDKFIKGVDDQLAFDKRLRILRAELLDKLLNYLEDQDDACFQETDHNNETITKIKLETLMWGGDEVLFVLPASQGFKVLARLLEWTNNWEIKKDQETYSLTHAFGLLFCHHKTPVSIACDFVKNLADNVKDIVVKQDNTNQQDAPNIEGIHNCYNYSVLESIDIPAQSINQHFEICYGELASSRQNMFARTFDTADLASLANFLSSTFNKSTIHTLAQSVNQCSADDLSDLIKVEQRLSYITALSHDEINKFINCASQVLMGETLSINDKNTTSRALLWVLLTECWDYIALQSQQGGSDDAN
ncbi:hypothetical protein [Pseudoalteromonas rhizosphaerae]|uniref:hypothetical protein n=1 Tax=Pseudoalteromonas rhizosphaerae TaxID=2518973 RepID=UPI0021477884|nr:hypothetical protein [Pseudoalteromonas rhizosphaerae]